MTSTELLHWFTVPTFKDVYVLGSFAKRVTLYSQQVRALNLVAALAAEKIIRKGREVVVVGGGAAGLTAAAGAAKCGAKVLVLEEFESLMEPLRSNRQRWLHPFIYDWPVKSAKEQTANLPLLNWNAGYAEQVAEQLRTEWDRLVIQYSINVKLRAKATVTKAGGSVIVSWEGADKGELWDRVVILAVGFGFEPHNDYQYSYWTEDDIDGGFRKNMDGEWLISGFGDGAFTDLMRLCLSQFRHAKIADMFATTSGIHDVEKELQKLVQIPDLTPEQLTKSFRELPLDSLEKELKKKQREGITVFLTGPDKYPYGPKASILNRLIVSVLEKIGAFKLLEGKTDADSIRAINKRLEITVGGQPRQFDRVIVRHGPKPRAVENFADVATACKDLRDKWDKGVENDRTQVPQWPKNFFGPEGPAAIVRSGNSYAQFLESARRFPVRALSLAVSKTLRKDGVSTVKYEIEDLLVLKGKLSGLKFYYESTIGYVGQPELGLDAQSLGLVWRNEDPVEFLSDSQRSFDSELTASRDRARKLVGTLLFPKPRTPDDPPISFDLTITVLNADASSAWEFEQLYPPRERLHVNGSPLESPMEYMARVVWFPVETLKMRVTLPDNIPGPVWPSFFQMGEAKDIDPEDVVKESVLQMYPPRGSSWALPSLKWSKQPTDPLLQSGQFSAAAQSSELSITWPTVGSCYSLDWRLPTTTGSSDELKREEESREFRRKLLLYQQLRIEGKAGGQVRTLFADLYEKIKSKYKTDDEPGERFAISLLTYDEENSRLKLVDSVTNSNEFDADLWKFWLPFGAGLSGVCFKQQDSFPLIYLAPRSDQEKKDRTGPELYLPLPNMQHSILVAFPLEHPGYLRPLKPSDFETARQRLAVIDIGSDSKRSKLLDLAQNRKEDFEHLNSLVREFRDGLFGILQGGRP